MGRCMVRLQKDAKEEKDSRGGLGNASLSLTFARSSHFLLVPLEELWRDEVKRA
jgi:hypothetical protein